MNVFRAIFVFFLMSTVITFADLKLEKIEPKTLAKAEANLLKDELKHFKKTMDKVYFDTKNKSSTALIKVYPWLGQDSYEDIRKSIDMYGIESFVVEGHSIVMQPDKRLPNIVANYSRIDEGLIIINGYKVPHPKNAKQRQELFKKISSVIKSKGIEFFQDADAFIRCTEEQIKKAGVLVSLGGDVAATCSGNIVPNTISAIGAGIIAGCRSGSAKKGLDVATDNMNFIGTGKKFHDAFLCKEGEECSDASK